MNADRNDDSPTFWQRHADHVLGIMALGVLVVGTVAYHNLEGWSWVDSLYFSSVAVTTVGFGDLSPSTDASKLFTVFYIFSGIAIITVWLNLRLKHRVAQVGSKRGIGTASVLPESASNETPSGLDATEPSNPED